MACCAIATCNNYHRKTKGSNIRYHKFPKDPSVVKEWLRRCKRKDKFNINNAKICSDHFNPEDYDDDMKNRLLLLPEKKILKPTAVPSNFLPYEKREKLKVLTTKVARNERIKKRNTLKSALERIYSLKKDTESSNLKELSVPNNTNSVEESSSVNPANCSKKDTESSNLKKLSVPNNTNSVEESSSVNPANCSKKDTESSNLKELSVPKNTNSVEESSSVNPANCSKKDTKSSNLKELSVPKNTNSVEKSSSVNPANCSSCLKLREENESLNAEILALKKEIERLKSYQYKLSRQKLQNKKQRNYPM